MPTMLVGGLMGEANHFLGNRLWVRHQFADQGDAIGTGLVDKWCIIETDSADSNERKVADEFADRTYSGETDHLLMVGLRGGLKYRADGYVVDGPLESASRLLNGMC